MGAMARQGPHHLAQKSTKTGESDFKTSGSKFASVTSTIPFPAIFFLLVVTSPSWRTLHRAGVAGPDDLCSVSGLHNGSQLVILTLSLDARRGPEVARQVS